MSNYIDSYSILEHFTVVKQRKVPSVSDDYLSILNEYVNKPRYVTSIRIVSSSINISVPSILSFLRGRGIILKEGGLSGVTEEILDVLAELYVAKMKKYFCKTVFRLAELNPQEYTNLLTFCKEFSNTSDWCFGKIEWENIDCGKIKKHFFETVRINTEYDLKYDHSDFIYKVLVSFSIKCLDGSCFRFKKIAEILKKLIWSSICIDNRTIKSTKRQFVSIVDYIIKPFRYHIFIDEESIQFSVVKVVRYFNKILKPAQLRSDFILCLRRA